MEENQKIKRNVDIFKQVHQNQHSMIKRSFLRELYWVQDRYFEHSIEDQLQLDAVEVIEQKDQNNYLFKIGVINEL